MGVREWRVDDKGALRSTNVGGAWLGREVKARCLKPDFDNFWYTTNMMPRFIENLEHPAPHRGCGCGLYAFYDLDSCKEHGDNFSHSSSGIRGVVSAWGKTISAEYGFRSEYMRLEALIAEREPLDYWGAELSLIPAYESLAKKHGCALIKSEEVSAFMGLSGGVVLESDPQPEEEPEDLAAYMAQITARQMSTSTFTITKSSFRPTYKSQLEEVRKEIERLDGKKDAGFARDTLTLFAWVFGLASLALIIMVVIP
jgi:hypothetical protein